MVCIRGANCIPCNKPWFCKRYAICTPCNKPWFGFKLHPVYKPWFVTWVQNCSHGLWLWVLCGRHAGLQRLWLWFLLLCIHCTQRMIVADGCCCTRSVRCTQPCVRESLSSMAAWCQRTGAVVRGRELHEEHRDATPVCMRRHTRASVIAAQPPRTRSTRIDARHPPDAPGFPTCSVP